MDKKVPVTNALRRSRDLYADPRELARNGAFHASRFFHQRPKLSTLLGVSLEF